MKRGDKVQFIRDVTWFDLLGDYGHDRVGQIAVPIWSVGTVKNPPDNGIWAQIVTDDRPEGYGFPEDTYELIAPSQ